MIEEFEKIKEELQDHLKKVGLQEGEIADLKMRLEQECKITNDFKKENNNLIVNIN